MLGLHLPVTAGSAAWPSCRGAHHPVLHLCLLLGQLMVPVDQGTELQLHQGTAGLLGQVIVALQDQGTAQCLQDQGTVGQVTVRNLD